MSEEIMNYYIERFKELLEDFEEEIADNDYEEGYDNGYEDGVKSAREQV